MRSYTNKDGELITVSEEHLRVAIDIKIELQKMSASRRCSWGLHKKMMEREGYYDSDTNESYRCLIKDTQKAMGELPSVAKHADLVADNKLVSIKELVGELAYEKRENQHYLREINKGKRELIDFAVLANEIREAIEAYDFSQIDFEQDMILPVSDKKMIVCLSDLHIGALVDTEINTYNFHVAVDRLTRYANRIIQECIAQSITDIYVVNLGDTIEHSSMRFSQGYNAEFTFSEQIVRASDIIIKFLMFLSRKGFNITYSGIAGNHDRITDKDKNIDGDHAVKPINYAIQVFIENAGIENIKFEKANDYSHSLAVNGRNLKFVHGDLDSLKDDNLVAKHSSIDKVDYDAVIMGHFHHFREMEVGFDKRVIVFGSLKGADEYGEKIRKISIASQGIITVNINGEMEVTQVKLH